MEILDQFLEYVPMWLVLVDIVLLVLVYYKPTERHFLRPVVLVPFVLIIYALSGTLNLIFFQSVVGWYVDVVPLNANRIALLGTLGLLTAIIVSRLNTMPRENRVEFEQRSLLRWILWGTLVGGVFNAVNFASIGGIPIFWHNLTGFERFEIGDKLPLPKFMIVSSTILTLNVLYIVKRFRPRFINTICTVINLVIAVGIGSRSLIFLPLIIAILFLMFRKTSSAKVVLAFLGIAAFMMVALQVLRGEDYSLEAVNAVAAYGGEYRDYLLLRDYFSYTDYQHGATILPMFTNAIPKQLFSLVSLNKDDYSLYSAYLAQDLWGAETGIRTGIWGEFYMNWGDAGVLVGFTLFGVFVGKLDQWLRRHRYHEPNLLFLSFIYTLTLFAIIGSWATIGDTLEVYGVLYFLLSRVILSQTQSSIQPSLQIEGRS